MSINNSGGREDKELESKLGYIDKWLSNLTHKSDFKSGETPSPQFNKPKPPMHKPFKRDLKKPSKPPSTPHAQPTSAARKPGGPELRIIPLGGFEEVGKNTMAFEYGNDIIIVDLGFQFPTEDMLGIDYVLPDLSYLEAKKQNIRGIYLTHGHLDHIGGLPYLLPKLGFPPVFGAPLTIGFVEKQLTEFKLTKQAKLIKFDPKEKLRAGAFELSFFRVNHSIPDAVAIVIDTPCGRVVHTGDFKFDFTPADQKPADFQEIASVGAKGVLALISDSTNSLEPGHTVTEQVIAKNLDDIVRDAKGRLIVTSFSSLIGRLQQVFDSAVRYNRKIFLTGRSMQTNIQIAQNLGYVKVPRGIIMDIRKLDKFRDEEVMILTTGSQGEDVSALARMAMDTHHLVKIQKGDTVVLSSSPIIGNESAIVKVLNGLARRGARIVTNRNINVHTSGHAKQEDLKLMIKLIKPKYLIPAHGDYYMRMAHRDLAASIGHVEANTFLLDNGEVVVATPQGVMEKSGEKLSYKYIMVEGPERSLVANHVLMDRQLMAENGALFVLIHADLPQGKLKERVKVISRGFVYLDSTQEIMEKTREAAEKGFEQFITSQAGRPCKLSELQDFIQQTVDRAIMRLVDKRPLIVPIFT